VFACRRKLLMCAVFVQEKLQRSGLYPASSSVNLMKESCPAFRCALVAE
jgi:hypothetical protein